MVLTTVALCPTGVATGAVLLLLALPVPTRLNCSMLLAVRNTRLASSAPGDLLLVTTSPRFPIVFVEYRSLPSIDNGVNVCSASARKGSGEVDVEGTGEAIEVEVACEAGESGEKESDPI